MLGCLLGVDAAFLACGGVGVDGRVRGTQAGEVVWFLARAASQGITSAPKINSSSNCYELIFSRLQPEIAGHGYAWSRADAPPSFLRLPSHPPTTWPPLPESDSWAEYWLSVISQTPCPRRPLAVGPVCALADTPSTPAFLRPRRPTPGAPGSHIQSPSISKCAFYG